MPRLALNICFATPHQALIEFAQTASATITFASPVTPKDLEALRWYIEVYATQYTGEPDDEEAKRIEAALTTIGDAFFKALFPTPAALAIFQRFQQQATDKLLTIHTNDAEILALPWELLHQPQLGFLSQQPPVAIRRFCINNQVPSFTVQAKPILRLLFIVSRPSDEGFLNPRLEPQAVLDALAEHKITQIEVEFLRPATFAKLQERLQNKDLPAIDIIHFDGHGSYDETAQCGYLAFEKSRVRGNAIAEKTHAISATQLAELFIPHHIALVVLSACQSAAVGNEPLGSVAAGLTDKGVPSVLAMVYSVLTTTTRQLFSAFYQQLATGQGIGTALDSARQAMAQHNKRGKRRRGEGEFELSLQDWFVPALYQSGHDTALLTQPDLAGVKNLQGLKHHDLPALQTAGFFGRSGELWAIERGYVQGVERITITGFGGQGKTYCAIEAAQWLLRTDLFDAVCYVDFSRYQGLDALRYAMNALGVLLDTTLPDETAVPPLLQTRRLLWVWDNLESLAAETLDELLAVAVHWSEHCRFLFTTRQHRFTQADYAESSPKHRYLDLCGLAEIDALAYFNQLWQTAQQPEQPYPARYELLALFSKVAFHPLSIGLLAQQLKTRTIAELGERLEALLLCEPEGSEDKSLLASLKLSLERLSPEQRELVKRLGVFQGGAMENELFLEIIESYEADWISLCLALKNTGLIQIEPIHSDITASFLKFHPSLAPTLWEELNDNEQQDLAIRYREAYYQLSSWLNVESTKYPYLTRAIAQCELPNLLSAIHSSLQQNEIFSLIFVSNINIFLNALGWQRDKEMLTKKVQHVSSEVGSIDWYLASFSQGELLLNLGEYLQAIVVFKEILNNLNEENKGLRCLVQLPLGRCLFYEGNIAMAINCFRQSLTEAEQLDSTDNQIQRHISVLHTELADCFRVSGDYAQAKTHYEKSLIIKKSLSDIHGIAITEAHLGTLGMSQGDLDEAENHYKKAIKHFSSLNDEKNEAIVWNQLGNVYQYRKAWIFAEQAYRKSAKIKESLGYLAMAAETWLNLAIVSENQGRLDAAEGWNYKALVVYRKGNSKYLAVTLCNLASLHYRTNRLNEAKQYAEEALVIGEKLDSSITQIWKIYRLLADVHYKLKENEKASYFRQLSRHYYLNFDGMREELQEYNSLILTASDFMIKICHMQPNQRIEHQKKELAAFKDLSEESKNNLLLAIQEVFSGIIHFDLLDYKPAGVVYLILEDMYRGTEYIENVEIIKRIKEKPMVFLIEGAYDSDDLKHLFI